ncbi:hypothetical protein MTQ01_20160 [Streptomyces sp. XM4193]|uniref:hypothetical protein n=1 Tax=Streptomyces sp. XM4193 TaxID=2929782 RepID=UPI001FF90188|nr:hypothetical protein [Streptomyces sp. XM4193]MCK1798298.1 hypothetical protein [Streptomyces sp. XM4193]
MPRGRHRQELPLHRLLVPAGVAAFALLCAVGALFVGDAAVLRVLTAAAAVAAVVGAVLLRSWDSAAGRRAAEAHAERANTALLADERAAESATELRKSRELRTKLEKRLRTKRAQLAALRTEHAALLRRYANAETQRASALEGRRQLAIAAAEPVKALTTGAADHRAASGAPSRLTYLQADQALANLRRSGARQQQTAEADRGEAEQPAAARQAPGDEPSAAGTAAPRHARRDTEPGHRAEPTARRTAGQDGPGGPGGQPGQPGQADRAGQGGQKYDARRHRLPVREPGREGRRQIGGAAPGRPVGGFDFFGSGQGASSSDEAHRAPDSRTPPPTSASAPPPAGQPSAPSAQSEQSRERREGGPGNGRAAPPPESESRDLWQQVAGKVIDVAD